ncbi:hypothetical protein CYMTET_6349 [Cymbomonas tetramitiformis]|uniref:Uncharacterized protein n=1 Tax=Cymbomonas tetramitiformis TaxID=36881 RepID=A0AAE0GXQ1_9CHLO|nr:hypothetical protein CYMTET_6349 [Cymbomonas tetramitiformis]
MWESWGTLDVRQVLESLRDLVVGSTVSKAEWESVRFEILACFAAIAEPLRAAPQEVLAATRELVTLGLQEEGAGSGPLPVFAGASEWPLRGTWTSARAVAKKRMKSVKAWGTTMLAGLAAAPALTGGSGALGLVGNGGASGGASSRPAGTFTLTHAQLMELLDMAVAKAAAAAGGAPGASAGGASASGAEGQYRKALAASQGKRDGWSVERHKQVRASVLAEGAKLRDALLRFRSEHSWKRPGTALEAHAFPELTWARPILDEEGCDIDELPAGEEASLKDCSRMAPAGAGEAPARELVAGEGHEPEDDEEEDDVMSVANAFAVGATPATSCAEVTGGGILCRPHLFLCGM